MNELSLKRKIKLAVTQTFDGCHNLCVVIVKECHALSPQSHVMTLAV